MRQKCMPCHDIRIAIHIKEVSMQDIGSSASERHLSLYPLFLRLKKKKKNSRDSHWESYLVMCGDLGSWPPTTAADTSTSSWIAQDTLSPYCNTHTQLMQASLRSTPSRISLTQKNHLDILTALISAQALSPHDVSNNSFSYLS